MYTDDSSALKTEYYTADAPKKRTSGKTADVKSTAKSSRKRAMAMKKRIVKSLFVAFLLSLIVILRYAIITAEHSELAKTKEELESVNAQVVEKQAKVAANMDPKKLEQEAARLAFKPPSKGQIEYIALGNVDNGEVLKVEKKSSFSAFINRISVILGYLY